MPCRMRQAGDWAFFVGKHRRLLGRQAEALGLGIVGQILRSGVISGPFPDIACREPGVVGQLKRRLRSFIVQGFVKAELFAYANQTDAVCAAEIVEELAKKFIQFRFVYGGHQILHPFALSRQQ